MAKRKKGRPVHGILLLDKPVGVTSNRVLQQVKRMYDAQKAGHTGSLDPLASGLLPICFGEATKVSGFLLDANKTYRGTIKLGTTTTTADGEGEVIDTRPIPELTDVMINRVLAEFLGPIMQVPPMHSALKQNGQPLYKLAHQGIEVERQPRQVTIHELTLLSRELDTIEIYLHCSKGTYVRTLAEDIGAKLGCGAHLSALRRLASEPFTLEQAVTLDMLESADQASLDKYLLPIESALPDWPAVALSVDAAYYVKQGNPVLVPRAPTDGWVTLFASLEKGQSEFLGVGEILDDGRVAPRRLLVR